MAIKYRVKPKNERLSGSNNQKYYAVRVQRGEVDLEQLSKDLAKRSSLSKGDVYACMIELSQLLGEYIQEGYNVRLDGLGIFSMSVTSKGFERAEDCTPRHVSASKLCFRADKRLKESLKNLRFERD
jgi:predicted histone-like DNA-binding protein